MTEQKQQHLKNFVQWNLDSFNPSIKEELLQEALDLAETMVEIWEKYKKLIFQTKTSLLYNDCQPWAKKGNKPIDITIGIFFTVPRFAG